MFTYLTVNILTQVRCPLQYNYNIFILSLCQQLTKMTRHLIEELCRRQSLEIPKIVEALETIEVEVGTKFRGCSS